MPLAVRDLFASPSRWNIPTVLEYEGSTSIEDHEDGEKPLGEGFVALELPRDRGLFYEIGGPTVGDLGIPFVDRAIHGALRELLTSVKGRLLAPIRVPAPPPIPPRSSTPEASGLSERTRQTMFKALAKLAPRLPEDFLRGLALGWDTSVPAWADWIRQIMLIRGWAPPDLTLSPSAWARGWVDQPSPHGASARGDFIEEPTTWRAETGETPSEVSYQLAALDRRIRTLANTIASNWWAMPEGAKPSWTAFLQNYGGFASWTRSAGPKSFGRRGTLRNLQSYQSTLAAWERYWDAMMLPRAPRYLAATSGLIPGIPFI